MWRHGPKTIPSVLSSCGLWSGGQWGSVFNHRPVLLYTKATCYKTVSYCYDAFSRYPIAHLPTRVRYGCLLSPQMSHTVCSKNILCNYAFINFGHKICDTWRPSSVLSKGTNVTLNMLCYLSVIRQWVWYCTPCAMMSILNLEYPCCL